MQQGRYKPLFFLHHYKNALGIKDEVSLKKQNDLQHKNALEKGHRIPWYRDVFRSTSKVVRKILRFFKKLLNENAFRGTV